MLSMAEYNERIAALLEQRRMSPEDLARKAGTADMLAREEYKNLGIGDKL